MVTGLLCLGIPALAVLILAAKGRRARKLSGTVSDRPVFSVEPPHRRLSDRKYEAL